LGFAGSLRSALPRSGTPSPISGERELKQPFKNPDLFFAIKFGEGFTAIWRRCDMEGEAAGDEPWIIPPLVASNLFPTEEHGAQTGMRI